MKALILTAAQELSVEEIDAPVAEKDETILDVQISGIGGSEYLGYLNPGIRSLPSIMGHGFAGLTPEGERVAVNPLRSCGSCEFCTEGRFQLCFDWSLIGVQSNGGFAEKAAAPTNSLVSLPDGLTWEQAAFIEPFANSVNAWELSGASKHTSIAIVGSGSLGLGLVACAKAANGSVIDVVEPSTQRQKAALELGATTAASTLSKAYDIVFDTVGSMQSKQQSLALTRKDGKLVLLGFASQTMEFNSAELIRHQKQILGAFVYSARQFRHAMTLAAHTDSNWVQNLSFGDVEPALIQFANGNFSVVKAALRPNL